MNYADRPAERCGKLWDNCLYSWIRWTRWDCQASADFDPSSNCDGWIVSQHFPIVFRGLFFLGTYCESQDFFSSSSLTSFMKTSNMGEAS